MIRPELREGAFRKWEDIIAKAVDAWPSPLTVHVPNMSQNTVISRLRDAIKSYETYGWTSKVNSQKFTTGKIRLSVGYNEDGTTYIGPHRSTLPKGSDPVAIVKELTVDFSPFPSDKHIYLAQKLAACLHHELIPPVRIINADGEISFESLTNDYDIAVTRQGHDILIV